MTSMQEREHILSEYGAWVEKKTLTGMDLSVDEYLIDLKLHEDAAKLETIHQAAIEGSTATFLKVAFETLGFKEPKEAPRELD